MKLATVCLGLCLFSALLLQHSAAQSCTSEIFSNREYSKCSTLTYLSATLHWTYHPSNGTLDVAYRAQQISGGWVAWAINPTGTQMDGANAFLAYYDASSALTVITNKLGSSGVTSSGNENLTFTVHSKEVFYENGYYTIQASLDLPNNSTTQNTVWQSSTSLSNGAPSGHPLGGDNVQSMARIDFLSGEATSGSNSKLHRKNTHGVLCAISWGIMMPIGAIIARYLKVFKSADPAWFYLHIAFQCSAYIIGLSGWSLGLKLGSESAGIVYTSHRNIGIALFCIATVQMLALFLRPNKEHKHRIYWNIYHRSFAISILVLSIINIFKGFDILQPADKWKHAYIAIIATLGGIAVLLEVVTLIIKIKRKKAEKTPYGATGANGFA